MQIDILGCRVLTARQEQPGPLRRAFGMHPAPARVIQEGRGGDSGVGVL